MRTLVIGLLLVTPVGAVAADEAPPPHEVVDVAALLQKLGSDNFHEREAATRELGALPLAEPPPELLALLRSSNPEVRDRAVRAVRALRAAAAVRRLSPAERLAVRGRADLLVAASAADEASRSDAQRWEPALQLGRALIQKAGLKGGRVPRDTPPTHPSYAAYQKSYNARTVRTNGVYERAPVTPDNLFHSYYPEAILCAGIKERYSTGSSLVLARGDVKVAGALGNSYLAVNGRVDVGNDVHSSIVVCDGPLSVEGSVTNSLLIARGPITLAHSPVGSTVISGAEVHIKKPRPLPLLPAAPVLGPPEFAEALELVRLREAELIEAFVIENCPQPLGFVTFFELTEVGVEVAAVRGVVTIVAVKAGTAAAAAGIKAGDVVLGVGGKQPADAESLRCLLRDALALGDATVRLNRDAATVGATLKLPE